MSLSLSIDADFSSWIKLLEDIQVNCNAENLLSDAGKLMTTDVGNQFLEQGDPDWEPLSEKRIRIRARKNSLNLLTLIDTGSLLRSWISDTSTDHVMIVDDESITVGTNKPKAALLQGGGQNEDGAYVPARPIRFREQVVEEIANSVLGKLVNQV